MNGSPHAIASTFLQLFDGADDDFDALKLLTTLSRRCVELFEVSSSGVLLADSDGAQTIAASHEQATWLELLQIDIQEGPGLDAFRFGKAVFHGDLREASPWPRFAREAAEARVLSVHAFPMRAKGTVVGSLSLFMTDPGPLSDSDVALAQAFAHGAAIAIVQHKTVSDLDRLTVQLKRALSSRVIIEQAKGTIAERAGIGMDEAFEQLRSYARTHKMKLTNVALAVVAHTLSDAEIKLLSGGSDPRTVPDGAQSASVDAGTPAANQDQAPWDGQQHSGLQLQDA